LHRPRYPFALRAAEIGCFLSHRRAWREILDRERAVTQIFYGPGVAHFERNPDDPSAAPELVVEPLPVGR
jgi:hypothetical protein